MFDFICNRCVFSLDLILCLLFNKYLSLSAHLFMSLFITFDFAFSIFFTNVNFSHSFHISYLITFWHFVVVLFNFNINFNLDLWYVQWLWGYVCVYGLNENMLILYWDIFIRSSKLYINNLGLYKLTCMDKYLTHTYSRNANAHTSSRHLSTFVRKIPFVFCGAYVLHRRIWWKDQIKQQRNIYNNNRGDQMITHVASILISQYLAVL